MKTHLLMAAVQVLMLGATVANSSPEVFLDCDPLATGQQQEAYVDPGETFEVGVFGASLLDLDTFDIEVVVGDFEGSVVFDTEMIEVNPEFGGTCGFIRMVEYLSPSHFVVSASIVGQDEECAPDGDFLLFKILLTAVGDVGDKASIHLVSARMIDVSGDLFVVSGGGGFISTGDIVWSDRETWSSVRMMYR